MGIASMVIGIVSVVFGMVPLCGAWAIIPAIIGLVLGVADLVVKARRKEPRGAAIAGVILNPIAIISVLLWGWLFVANIQPMPADSLHWQQSQSWHGGPGQPLQPMQPIDPDPAMKPMHPVDPAPPVVPPPGP